MCFQITIKTTLITSSKEAWINLTFQKEYTVFPYNMKLNECGRCMSQLMRNQTHAWPTNNAK